MNDTQSNIKNSKKLGCKSNLQTDTTKVKKITISRISTHLSITKDYFKKILNKVGIKRKAFLTKSDLIFIKDNLSSTHYKANVMKLKLETFIKSM